MSMKIGIKADDFDRRRGLGPFEGDEYVIDFHRKREGDFDRGSIRCFVAPWSNDGPLFTLKFDIRRDGSMQFFTWEYSNTEANNYLHADWDAQYDHKNGRLVATPAQKETVLGLWSGRLRFEGLNLPVGRTLMEVAGLLREDFAAEEARCGHKILLA